MSTCPVSDAPISPGSIGCTSRPKPSANELPVPSTCERSQSVVVACLVPVMVSVMVRAVVAFGWLHGTDAYNDAADYFAESVKLYEGTREATPFYWPPGTSYYLAGWFTVFGPSIMVARVAMIVLSSLQTAIVCALTYQATGKVRVAALSAWLWALYPPSVLLVFQPYSQHLAAFALAAVAWSGLNWFRTQSWGWLVTLGVFLGIGCLTRPSLMSVVLLTACTTFVVAIARYGLNRKTIGTGLLQAMLVCGTAGAVLTPTILHNARTGGGYSLSTNNERNFFLGNNPYTPWYKTSHFAQRHLDELPADARSYLLSYYDRPNARTAMKAAAVQHIASRPDLALLRTLNRARAFWGFDYLGSRVIQATIQPHRIASLLVLVAEAGGYCLVMVCALLALARFQGQMNRTIIAWYLALACAYAGPYCLAFSSGTYHFPVMGLMIPLAAVGLDSVLGGRWRQAISSARAWTVLLIFVAMQVEYAYFTLLLSNATI